MSITTDLVAECVRAANSLEKLSSAERRLLIERGVTTSRALRSLLIETGASPVFDIETEQVADEIARKVEMMTDTTIMKTLLALAEDVRQMRILNYEHRLRRKRCGNAG
ncbi:hypothetical protein J2T09_004628 [Neorhizobium huautlense]|uniref:Uncharacterized protein n=1 Tax=Neorhizobium huautlense TaxID=67774 RepID=A0ABT9PZD4_9HYPH|nr:hypothetical protein [Neorhizobium huautlense]MDP9839848.1 hypothetical protein [Neorhizobium huautlense]